MNDVKLTLNIRQPPANSGALSKAATKKQAATETMDEAWARILAMKNSIPDEQRLLAVKRGMEAGRVGRDSPDKRFSKAEALRMWRILDVEIQAERLREMVDNMPSNYELITDKPTFERFLKILESEDEIVFDVETTGVDIWSDHIVGHVISAIKANIHAYIPTKHDVGEQLPHDYVTEGLRPIYEDASVGKLAHNAKYDIHMLARDGVTLRGLTWDTLEAMKLLNENEMSYALKPLVTKYLKEDSQTYGELFGQRGFNEIPLDEAVAYAAKDGDVTLRLRDFQRKHLSQMPSVLEYYETVEVPLIPIIVEMESEGYEIDLGFANVYGDELREKSAMYGERVFSVLGDINLNSPVQLKTAIEAHVGKSIADTDAKRTLKPLSKEFPIIADLLKYRETNKLLSTYVDALPTLIKEKTGRIHTQFHQNGAKTGRFSSGGGGSFNVQNQPAKARELFIAPEGYYIVAADFSAQEVRIIASESGEDVLLEAFAKGVDAYATLASEFFGKPYEECYKLPNGDDTDERKKMKVVLLMSMYGASKYGLATALGITPKEAEQFLTDFFAKYSKIDAFIKRTQDFAGKHGFVWIGAEVRKRRLPDAAMKRTFIPNGKYNDPKYAEAKRKNGLISLSMRQGPNAKIQGLAAIQTKVTMIKLAEVAKERGWKLWSTTHDEVQLLMPTSIGEYDLRLLDEVMTQSFVFGGVENKTDIDVQKRWSNAISAKDFLRGVPVPEADINE